MNYIALTIGPIYKTISLAKSTREIWGASYFFSYIIKQIIIKIKNKDIEFITPFVDENKIENKNGVGLFHDRIILRSSSFTKSDLDEVVKEVLKGIEKESKNYLRYNFLKNYLQIYTIEINEDKIKNPILNINPYLDTAELFYQTQLEEKNLIINFVKNRLSGSFLAVDAFGKNKISFPSLPKIALSSVDFKIDEDYQDEQELMANLIKNYKDKIKPYHKYIAIVQADGDNMGAVLEQIGANDTKRTKFSEALFDFCVDSTKKVEEFNGRMIYAGGDDLLFFAPIVNKNETIFHLIDRLNDIFNTKIKEITKDLNLEKNPTLSFGVSITYYKFPLYEARFRAVELLFAKAKKGSKNQIAYQVTKHSGQTFEGIIKKDDMFKEFLEIIQFNDKSNANFLHSFYTKIDNNKIIIDEIGKKEDKRIRFKNFFDNYFNENEHKKYKNFFEDMVDFFTKVYDNNTIKEKINYIYSTLRFKKFLLGDKK